MGSSVRGLSWFVVISVLFYTGDCLHCFRCADISENEDCRNVTQCLDNQKCYVLRHGHNNATNFSFGCMDSQSCPDHHDFTIVGRAADDRCFQCCLGDGCNRELCEIHHLPGMNVSRICADDPASNCSHLSEVLNICSDIPHAKTVCRKFCGLCALVDGSWNHWSSLTQCSTSCGIGTAQRHRTCTNPVPQHGGDNCPGNDTQIHSCYLRNCPVHGEWSSWALWEKCSVSCDVGVRKRHRTCTNPSPSIYGHNCIGDAAEYSICHQPACSNVTTTVHPNMHIIDCHDLVNDCETLNRTIQLCDLQPANARITCPEFCDLCSLVNGAWSNWLPWGICSTTCNNGSWTRTRTCTNPAPAEGGKPCLGNNTEIGDCNLRPCPVHGGWSDWVHWISCSSSCGPGITKRIRSCTNPRPSLLGNDCFGDSTEYTMCQIKPCPVNGGWSKWSYWSGCSVTCGSGQRARQRFCLNPRPVNGGQNCSGTSEEHQACQTISCTGLKVGFTVYNPDLNSSSPLIFKGVLTNALNGYNATSGMFTCPYSGLYLFTMMLMRDRGYTGSTFCRIYVNGRSSGVQAEPDSGTTHEFSSGTNTLVKHLNKGDTVYLACYRVSPLYFITSFSGVLIQPDDIVP